jgi:ketosteroid isomerase-like protein
VRTASTLFALALGLGGQSDSAVVRELEKIEQQLAATYQAGDCAAWGAMLAPEWSVTHITAQVITKAQALEMCAAAKGQIADAAIDDISVRVFGDAAVATGRTTATTSGTSPLTVTLRFTDVFIRRSDRWLVVASHATRIGG